MRSAEHARRAQRLRSGLAASVAAGLVVLLTACSNRPLLADAAAQKPAPAAPVGPDSASTPAPAASAPLPAPIPMVATAASGAARAAPEADAPSRAAFDAALLAMRSGRRAEAEQNLRVLSQAHPELGGAQANLGLLERQAGRLPQALAAFEQALRANPDQPVFHNQLGITLRQLGRFTEARQAYERALALDSQYAGAALNLGVLLDLYLGDAAGALAQYQRYLELTPAGDPVVAKWVVEIGKRKPPTVAVNKEAK